MWENVGKAQKGKGKGENKGKKENGHEPRDFLGVRSARWPDCPPQSGVAHGCSLIPVGGAGVVADEVKTGGQCRCIG